MVDISTTTLFIWFVRIALPAVFLLLWYRAQPKEAAGAVKRKWKDTGPTGNCLTREELLDVRKAVKKAGVPDSLATVKMVDEEKAPKSKERGGGGVIRRGAPNKESRGGRDKGAPRPAKTKNGAGNGEAAAANLNEEERTHLESLVNHVAFNRKEQQENTPNFGAKYPVKKVPAEPLTEMAKANHEAQMVLKGTVIPSLGAREKSADVAKDLFKKLTDESVEVEEDTFSLMIEACLNGGDLKSASDFLMKMETAGFCPESRLLDKVMDLYSYHKVGGERAHDWASEAAADLASGVKNWESTEWAAESTPNMPTPTMPEIAPSPSGDGGPVATFNFDAYSDDE